MYISSVFLLLHIDSTVKRYEPNVTVLWLLWFSCSDVQTPLPMSVNLSCRNQYVNHFRTYELKLFGFMYFNFCHHSTLIFIIIGVQFLSPYFYSNLVIIVFQFLFHRTVNLHHRCTILVIIVPQLFSSSYFSSCCRRNLNLFIRVLQFMSSSYFYFWHHRSSNLVIVVLQNLSSSYSNSCHHSTCFLVIIVLLFLSSSYFL